MGDLTAVGSYTLTFSNNGTFDQGGNVEEWNEAILRTATDPSGSSGSHRGVRGGRFDIDAAFLARFSQAHSAPSNEISGRGFRVASTPIPEPGTGLLVLTGMLGLSYWRRRRS